MDTQIETVEEVTESLARAFDNDNWKALQSLILDGINWQKQQDEAKYKQLLESHNELLLAAEGAMQFLQENGTFGSALLTAIINKAKNIKQ